MNANNRKVVTHRGHIEKAKARNETVKTRCAQIQKLNKKAALPPPLLNMLKTALQDVKNNEKLIGETEKLFKKFEKAVEKDLSKLGK